MMTLKTLLNLFFKNSLAQSIPTSFKRKKIKSLFNFLIKWSAKNLRCLKNCPSIITIVNIIILDVSTEMLKKAEKEYRNNTKRISPEITQSAALRNKSRSWKNIENNLRKKKRNCFERCSDSWSKKKKIQICIIASQITWQKIAKSTPSVVSSVTIKSRTLTSVDKKLQ